MSRIRTIKPEFFSHEALYEVERTSGLPVRLAFAGLWTQADRDGKFQWRPQRLKLAILPYDPVDFDEVLGALVTAGVVVKYEIDGVIYGAIPSWHKHQRPHHKEPPSDIPNHDQVMHESSMSHPSTMHEPSMEQVEGIDPLGREGKGREGKGNESCFNHEPSIGHPSTEPDASQGPRKNQTWPSWLATEFAFHFSGVGAAHRDTHQLGKSMQSLIDRDVPPEKIRDRIRARDRPKSEAWWNFEAWFFPRAVPEKPKQETRREQIERVAKEKEKTC